MKINKHLFDFILNRPSLLSSLLKVSNFEKIPALQKSRDKLLAKAIEGIYTAGETLVSAEVRIKELEQKQVGVILNYAMEAAGEDGIRLMESEYHKIMDCLKNHSFSCVALKPTALIPVEKILYLSNLMEKENYHEIDLENLLKNSELENIAEPFSKLSKKAVEIGTKILIDAEQSNLQPGVDLLALFLMKQFNINQRSHIYNTYQLYLKDSPLRIEKHKQLIESENAQFAAKLVRGAYLSYEQNIKENAHRNYKICASKTEVDHNYNITVRELISNGRSSLIVATHNLESVKLLKSIMSEKIQFHSNDIEYAFLMGFGDKVKDLTMGLRCLEYVPYGPSEVKIPYLLRRLEENVHIFKSEK